MSFAILTLRRALFAALALPLLVLAALPAAAQNSYLVQPGDTLQIEVVEDSSLNRTVLVAPDGRITVPLAGPIQAGGRTVDSIQQSLTQRLAPNFAASPTVFVGLSALAPPATPLTPVTPPTIDIFVIGEVNTAGRITTDPGTTVLELFAETGGFTPFAATRRIQLRRADPQTGQETIYLLDYRAILAGTSPNGTAELIDGDVIVVPERRLFE